MSCHAPCDLMGNVLGSQIEAHAHELPVAQHAYANALLAQKFKEQYEMDSSEAEVADEKTFIELVSRSHPQRREGMSNLPPHFIADVRHPRGYPDLNAGRWFQWRRVPIIKLSALDTYQFVKSMLPPAQTIVEVGCGNGYLTLELTRDV